MTTDAPRGPLLLCAIDAHDELIVLSDLCPADAGAASARGPWPQRFAETDHATVAAALAAVRESGRRRELDADWLLPDGGTVSCRCLLLTCPTDGGVLLFGQPTSGSELGLLFQRLAEHLGRALWLTQGGRVVFLTGAYQQVWGRSSASLREDPDSFLTAIDPEDQSRVTARWREAAAGFGAFDEEFRVDRPDGSQRWVRLSAVFEALGDPPQTICAAAADDVTETRRANRVLVAREAQFRRLVEESPSPVVVIEAGKFRYCNQAATRLLGHETPERLLGVPAKQYISSADLAVLEAAVGAALRDGQPREVTHGVLLPGGGIVQMESTICPTTYEGTGAVQLVSRDVTAAKRAQEARLRASRMEATATLAAGIAHDFNNLMVTVLGNSELLQTHVEQRSEAVDMLSEISLAAHRAGQLAQQLLAFARGGRYQTALIDLNECVREAVELQARSIPPRIRIEQDLALDPWPVEGDPTQLMQVVVNLLINAVESIEAHGQIRLTTRNLLMDRETDSRPGMPVGRYTYLAVEDTGCGMEPGVMRRVFEPFFSTKFQGRGLGLAAAYGIVTNHGGHLSVYSEVGSGSAFKVYLPADRHGSQRETGDEAELPGGRETILVVDDDVGVLQVARRMLGRLGYQVLTAEDGQTALDLARDHAGPLDLAVLDLRMPGMDAAEVYPRLCAARPGLKVVLCSGYDLDTSAQSLLDRGADAFIQKPFRTREICLVIRHALDDSERPTAS